MVVVVVSSTRSLHSPHQYRRLKKEWDGMRQRILSLSFVEKFSKRLQQDVDAEGGDIKF